MVKLHCLGGGHEVGRNSFLVETKSAKLTLDAGLKVESGELPLMPKTKVDACFVTHGHLDHLGSAPVLHRRTLSKFYMTPPTFDFSDLLLHDSIKVAKIKERVAHFQPADILRMARLTSKINYGDEIKLSHDCKVEVWDAGHIPGSAMFLLTVEGKKVL